MKKARKLLEYDYLKFCHQELAESILNKDFITLTWITLFLGFLNIIEIAGIESGRIVSYLAVIVMVVFLGFRWMRRRKETMKEKSIQEKIRRIYDELKR